MMKKFLLTAFLGFATGIALAQADLGRIVGVVSDPTGALVSNATITITNAQTGAVRTIQSGASGDFTAAGLTPGVYQVDVKAAGFGDAKQSFTLAVGGAATFNAKLGIENTTTEVDVAADNLGSLQLDRAELSQVINTRQILELPTATRDPYQLATLSGSVSSDASAASRGVGVNFSGARSSSTDILLDGAENTDLFGVAVGLSIPLDAVQEYRVITSGFGAEYGRASGGIVNVATKSGGNAIHGTAYEFNRISALASNDYGSNALGLPKGVFTRNQFGYSIGGPIIKNKLFLFNSTEWTRIRSLANIVGTVPTAALIAASNAKTQAFFANQTLQYPINGKTFTVAQVQALGYTNASDAAFTKLPQNLVAFGTVTYQAPSDSGGGSPQNRFNTIGRIDYTLSDKTQIFGRYTFVDENDFAGTVNSSPWKGYNTGQTNYDNNFLLSVTHQFSPSILSASKVLFSRLNNVQPLSTAPAGPTLYINPSSAPTFGNGPLNFPGYSQLGPGGALPFGGPQNFLQIGQDMTFSKGRHNIRFGGNYLYIKDNRTFGAYSNTVEALASSGIKGGLGRFVSGNLFSLTAALNPNGAYPCSKNTTNGAYTVTAACSITLPLTAPNFSRSNRFHDADLYLADSWKVTPRLTVDAGLRWEYYGPQHSNHPNLDANFYPGAGSTFIDQIRSGKVQTRETSPNNRLWKANFKQFAPRLGFAYDVSGNGKTSLRGSYGISYERNFNNVTFNVIQNPPNYGVVSFTAGVDAPTIDISSSNFGSFGSGTGTKALPNVTLRAVDPNIKPSYNQFYTLSVEHQLDRATVLGVAYTGERGIHNFSIANINRPASGAVYLGDKYAASRLNTQYGSINFRGADGDSYYNGVNVSLRSDDLARMGLTTVVNYTYAKSTDNTSSTFTDGSSNNANSVAYLDPFNHGLDHGNSDFDVRHRVVASLLWNIPFAKHTTGFTNRVLDGWEATTTFTANTGTPFSVFDCTNTAYAVCPRAIFNGNQPYARTGDEKDLSADYGPNTFSYLSLGAFTSYADPITGTGEFPTCTGLEYAGCKWPSGMTARNAFRGPGQWNEDFSMLKSFKIREGMSVQLRGEFFNVFNHANTYLNLSGTNDVSSYSDILSFKSGSYYSTGYNYRRNTQLAAKFIF